VSKVHFRPVSAGLIIWLSMCGVSFSAPGDPVINVWYGSNQVFGVQGTPQDWVNVLGDVSDSDGAVAGMTYRLNGGSPVNLLIGPDTRRLQSDGDFNVDIDVNLLIDGTNDVLIVATDDLGNQSTQSVDVVYNSQNLWPLPYSVLWTNEVHAPDRVQIVDGLWSIDTNGFYTVIVGYDRVVAIGDILWEDYEVTIPITTHSIDPAGFLWPSVSPGMGVIFRWTGHTDWLGLGKRVDEQC